MRGLTRRILRRLITMIVTVLLGAFLAAVLVRTAPGFDSNDEQLDNRLSNQSRQALRQARAGERNIFVFYLQYLSKAAHGDLGTSHELGRPVRDLLAARLPVTLKIAGIGLLLGWALAVTLAFSLAMARSGGLDVIGTILSGALLCIPAAVLAVVSVLVNSPGYLAIALIVFPKLFRYSHNLLEKSYELPHILTARAKGLGGVRILLWHVLPITWGQFIALAGVSASMALSAAIPVEALCGIPGVGQLAWQAALGRDLPLLVNLTVLITVVTLLANSGSDVVGLSAQKQEA